MSNKQEITVKNGSVDCLSLTKKQNSFNKTDQKQSSTQQTDLKITYDLDSDNTSIKDNNKSTGSLANLYRFADFVDYQVIYIFAFF